MIKQALKKGGRVKIWLSMHGVGGVSWYVFWLLNKENLLYIPMILQHFVVVEIEFIPAMYLEIFTMKVRW